MIKEIAEAVEQKVKEAIDNDQIIVTSEVTAHL